MTNPTINMGAYIAELEKSINDARLELTLVMGYANLLPQSTTNRAAIIARVGHALDELGGPVEKEKLR